MREEAVGHELQERFFGRCLAAGRVAHAYLLHGEEGLGKSLFARRLARAILCLSSPEVLGGDGGGGASGAPRAPGEGHRSFGGCGECRGCVQVDAGTHPDLMVSGTEGGGVRREQAEEVVRFLWLRPVAGPRRVAVVAGADALTPEAAAALLKTLEEPPGHGLIVLVADSAEAVPITLRSRCQAVPFHPLGVDRLASHLEARLGLAREEATRLATLAGGRPGLAFRMAGDDGWRRLWDEAGALLQEVQAAVRGGPGRLPGLAAAVGRLLAERGSDPMVALDVLALRLRERLGEVLAGRQPAGGDEPSSPGVSSAAARRCLAVTEAIAATLEASRHVSRHVNRRLVADVLALRLARSYAFELGGRLFGADGLWAKRVAKKSYGFA